MKNNSFPLIGLTLTLFIGCATAKIESNIRKGYTKKIDTIYIILSSSLTDAIPFFQGLTSLLPPKLDTHGIKAQVHIVNNLELDEKSIINGEIKTFKPNYILYFSQLSIRKDTVRAVGGTFELTLFESGNETPIWKASLAIDNPNNFNPKGDLGSYDTAIDAIVGRLLTDGLITPTNLAKSTQ
jgi:hypothetical protein